MTHSRWRKSWCLLTMKKKMDNMQAEHIYEMRARRYGTGSELLRTLKGGVVKEKIKGLTCDTSRNVKVDFLVKRSTVRETRDFTKGGGGGCEVKEGETKRVTWSQPTPGTGGD